MTFDASIAQKLRSKLWKGAVVIMDNCPIHKSQEIEALMSRFGATLMYLPPYSPDLSPIDELLVRNQKYSSDDCRKN